MTVVSHKSVIVRPAGAERETLSLALLCGAILLAAGTVVTLRTAPVETVAIAEWQIDARDGLTAAEQGINADLRVAAEDIAFALEGGTVPTPEELSAEALPPFAGDATTQGRGGHQWSLVNADSGFAGWLGRSASPEVAGSLLLRIATGDGHSHDAGSDNRVSVWLNRSVSALVPALSNEALIASGWKEVVSRYDASVTRGAGQ
ncbi:DUF6162 family protein [Aquamicrobium lusatiense]|uniref:DUF6162 family protein n=1 Tax=Aquamicrobium lusatiense TaxID=89772 RepID=UPI0024550E29|nr:DUF6162 family protein [Aquamicrobium lusatiense]MDH4990674.1 DUF6162 family protein [Aquamicrobium lusatiense]